MKKILGIDIGGTTVKMGLFSLDGAKRKEGVFRSSREVSPEDFLKGLAKEARRLVESDGDLDDLKGIGIGIPGPVENQKVVTNVVNLGWGKVPVVDILQAYFHCPIVLDNDANVAAMGELWQGAGSHVRSMILVTLGTGIGGGVIIDGKLVQGAHGAGGEVGHIPFLDHDLKKECGCGGYRCLELVASASGIIRRTREALEEGKIPSRLGRVRDLNAKHILDAAKAGDPLAQHIVEETGEYLGRGLAIISSVLDPEEIVIGGGVSEAGDIFLDPVRTRYRHYAFKELKETPIVKASLGNQAGMIGAARLVLDLAWEAEI